MGRLRLSVRNGTAHVLGAGSGGVPERRIRSNPAVRAAPIAPAGTAATSPMQQRAISDHRRRMCCTFVGMSEASGLHDAVERSGNVGGIETHWREAPSTGCPPVLYVHGVPTASWDWLPYLQRIGGIAPDLPGFGESAKPSDFDYSITRHERWLEAFTQAVGLERFSLVRA
jgi:alpha/beta hydrolase family protein